MKCCGKMFSLDELFDYRGVRFNSPPRPYILVTFPSTSCTSGFQVGLNDLCMINVKKNMASNTVF